jgi:hypothetical protein
MQISILSGTYASGADFRSSYPVNMVPVPKMHGLSMGYLRPAEGIKQFSTVTGKIRGAVNWKNEAYFVVDEKVLRVLENGTTELVDTITDDGKRCRFAFSFDRLAIASAGKLYYLLAGSITQVTDTDIGTVNDVKFVDGFFVTTDGEFILATDLIDPTSINPLRYGSSEIDPDPIVSLVVNRNELYAINRYTVEVFTNNGGAFFPFSRITGAHIQRGAVGRDAVCVYNEALAFVGSARNESPAVYLGENAQTLKLSTREIDQILSEYTEEQLSEIIVETRTDKAHKLLYIHLPNKTLVYDSAASIVMEVPVWHILTSSLDGFAKYRANNFVWCYNKWLCGDTLGDRIGYLSDTEAGHFGSPVRTEFATIITWSETGGAVFHALELQVLSAALTKQKIAASYTTDGVTWSQDRWAGEYQRRVTWPTQGIMHGWRAYRFRGTSDAMLSVARLDAKLEPLIL